VPRACVPGRLSRGHCVDSMPSPRLTAVVLATVVALPVYAQDTTSTKSAPPSQPPAAAQPQVKVDGFLQLWYSDGHTLTNAHDSYRVRRAFVMVNGVISPRVRWRVGVDAAKALSLTKSSTVVSDSNVLSDANVDQRSRILQDAAITITVAPALRLDVGQQLIPLSYEGVALTWNVETVARTMFIEERSRGGTLGDIRDIGATALGSIVDGYVNYQIGLFNEMGDSQNQTDANDQKATIGRVVFRVPGLSALQLGGSGGFEGATRIADRRERAGGEAQFRTAWLTLRSEVMGARDGTIRRLGYYGLGAIRPASDIELVGRWDYWDPDLHNESGPVNLAERQITAGGSYFIESGATRLSANFVRSTFPSRRLTSTDELLFGLHVVW